MKKKVLRFGTPGPGSYGGPEACDSHLVKKNWDGFELT